MGIRRIEKHAIRAMNQDDSPHLITPEFSRENWNIRVTAIGDLKTFYISNELGNRKITLVDENNQEISLPNNIIGYVKCGEYIVVFSVGDDENSNSIMRINTSSENLTWTVKEIAKGNFNFSIDNPIDGVYWYESEDIQKIYWIDGLNPVRFINIKNESNNLINNIDIQFKEFDSIEVLQSSGALEVGSYQYAYSLYNKYGYETPVGPISKLYFIGDGLRGLSVGNTTGNAIKLKLSNINGFDSIKIYRIFKESLDANPKISIIYDSYLSDNMTILDTGQIISNISYEEFLLNNTQSANSIVPQVISKYGNRLIFGNYSSKSIDIRNIKISCKELSKDSSGFYNSNLESSDPDYNVTYMIRSENTKITNFPYETKSKIGGENYDPYTPNEDEYYLGPITTFKRNETYRFGVQGIDKYGNLTEVLFLKDIKFDQYKYGKSNLSNIYSDATCDYIYDENKDEPNHYNATPIASNLRVIFIFKKSLIDEFKNRGIKSLRIVCVERNEANSTILSQGVLGTSLYFNHERWADGVWAYPDHIFRPFVQLQNKHKTYTSILSSEVDSLWNGEAPEGRAWGSAEDKTYIIPSGVFTPLSGGIGWHGDGRDGASCMTPFEFPLPGDSFRVWFDHKKWDIDIQTMGHPVWWVDEMRKGSGFDEYSGVLSPDAYSDSSILTFYSPEVTIPGLPKLDVGGCYANWIGMTLNVKNTTKYTLRGKIGQSGDIDFSNEITGYLGNLCTYNGMLKNDKESTGEAAYTTLTLFPLSKSDESIYDFDKTMQLYRQYNLFFNLGGNDISNKMNISWIKGKQNKLYNVSTEDAKIEIEFKIPVNSDEEIVTSKIIYSPQMNWEYHQVDSPSENNFSWRGKSANHIVFQFGDSYMFGGGVPFLNLLKDKSQLTTSKILNGDIDNTNTIERNSSNGGWDSGIQTGYIFNQFPSILGSGNEYKSSMAWQNNFGSQPDYRVVLQTMINDLYNNFIITKKSQNLDTTLMSYRNPKGDDFDNIMNEIKKFPINIIQAMIPVVEITRDIDNQYGDEDFAGNIYIPCGKFKEIGNDYLTLIADQGDTYITQFGFLKTYTEDASNTNRNMAEYVKVVLETSLNLNRRIDKSYIIPNGLINPNNIYEINNIYNSKNNTFKYYHIDDKIDFISYFPNKIISSKTKLNNSLVDNGLIIQPNEFMELEGSYGQIRAIKELNNYLYAFQDNAISYLLIQPRIQVSASDGVPIELGTGQFFNDYRYISKINGSINKWGISSTNQYLYFIDEERGSFMAMNNGGVQEIGSLKKMSSYFNNRYPHNGRTYNYNPLKSYGYYSLFCPTTDELYLVMKYGDNSHTLVYNEGIGYFTTFLDITPDFIIPMDGTFYSIKNNNIWKHLEGHSFYDIPINSSIEFIANAEFDYDKTYDFIDFRVDNSLSNRVTHHWDTIRAITTHQDSGEISLINGKNVKERFGIWRAIIPRNENSLRRMRDSFITLKLTAQKDYDFKCFDINVNYSI